MSKLFRKKEDRTSKEKDLVNLIRCSIFDCNKPAIGRFKPDARVLCMEHGVKYSQDWGAKHPNKVGLLGIIVQ
jgi:hypothetical protein